MTHQLTMHAYCGMAFPLHEGEEQECRDVAAQRIKRHRDSERGVAILVPGKEWEMLESETGFMVNDDEGVLRLKGAEE